MIAAHPYEFRGMFFAMFIGDDGKALRAFPLANIDSKIAANAKKEKNRIAACLAFNKSAEPES